MKNELHNRVASPTNRWGRTLGLVFVLFALTACSNKEPQGPTPEDIRTEQMTIYLKIDGGFYAEGLDAWHFFLDTTKGDWLTLLRYPQREQHHVNVSDEQLAAFREALIANHFFDTREEFGHDPGDKGFRGLRVSVGGAIHTIHLAALDDWQTYDAGKLDELQRVLRIWGLARSWFDEPSIVDYRELDQAILAGL